MKQQIASGVIGVRLEPRTDGKPGYCVTSPQGISNFSADETERTNFFLTRMRLEQFLVMHTGVKHQIVHFPPPEDLIAQGEGVVIIRPC